MDKRALIEQIREYLTQELEALKVSNGDGERIRELERLILMYRFLPTREYAPDEVVAPATLVELEFNNTKAYYYIAPQGGGLITRVGESAVQVITPNSPIGEALLGKKAGEEVSVETRSGTRIYRILSVR